MKRTPLSIPEIALIGGTRGALGAGLAFLLGDRLSREQRKAIGWALFGIGAITTVPILFQILKSQSSPSEWPESLTARKPEFARR